MLEVLTVKMTDQNKREDTAGTNNSCVVPRTWTVEVKATHLKTLSTATITQNKIWIWTIGEKKTRSTSRLGEKPVPMTISRLRIP
jgi:hypothetical protein